MTFRYFLNISLRISCCLPAILTTGLESNEQSCELFEKLPELCKILLAPSELCLRSDEPIQQSRTDRIHCTSCEATYRIISIVHILVESTNRAMTTKLERVLIVHRANTILEKEMDTYVWHSPRPYRARPIFRAPSLDLSTPLPACSANPIPRICTIVCAQNRCYLWKYTHIMRISQSRHYIIVSSF